MDIKSERSSGWLFYILVKIDLTLQRFGITCRTWSPPGCPWWGVRVGRKTKVLTHPQGKWPSGIMIKDVLMKIKMSTCVKVQETHFYQVSWRFSKKYILLRGGMPSLLKFLSIPLISLLDIKDCLIRTGTKMLLQLKHNIINFLAIISSLPQLNLDLRENLKITLLIFYIQNYPL